MMHTFVVLILVQLVLCACEIVKCDIFFAVVSNSTPEKSVGSIPLRNSPTIASIHSNGVLKNEGNGIYEADLTSTEPILILWI